MHDAKTSARSIAIECIRLLTPTLGESSLRRAMAAYVEHYHTERAHQGLGNERIDGHAGSSVGEIRCRERLGGLLKHYYRAA
jgi:hypothetical protein